MKRSFQVFITLLFAYFSTSVTLTTTAQAAVKPIPKVGSCYNLTKSNVDTDYSDIPAINCLKNHSSETYRVVKLAADNPAVNFDLAKAQSVCTPWKGASKFLNYWAWYIPNPEQQRAGQNWIRCDAMIVKDYNESTGDYTLISWRGKRLDIR
jgi:hypothetical protein